MNIALQPQHVQHAHDVESWPADVKFMLSVLADRPNSSGGAERRADARRPYRKRANVHLIDNAGNTWRVVPVYTRDVNETGLGLLTSAEMPIAARAILHLPSPGGRVWQIACSVVRCQRFIDHWFDAAVYFDQEQAALRAHHAA